MKVTDNDFGPFDPVTYLDWGIISKIVSATNPIRTFPLVQACAGNEVRGELRITAEFLLQAPGKVELTAEQRYFEGASCGTDHLHQYRTDQIIVGNGTNVNWNLPILRDNFGSVMDFIQVAVTNA